MKPLQYGLPEIMIPGLIEKATSAEKEYRDHLQRILEAIRQPAKETIVPWINENLPGDYHVSAERNKMGLILEEVEEGKIDVPKLNGVGFELFHNQQSIGSLDNLGLQVWYKFSQGKRQSLLTNLTRKKIGLDGRLLTRAYSGGNQLFFTG